jgi:anthranilate phosphoribosyltransferase
METIGAAIEKLIAGRSLSFSESHDTVASILEGVAGGAAVAAFMTALRVKGETADELEGAVSAVRERMIPFEDGHSSELLLDSCGTGGDGACTVNISTAAAIVVAACGSPVVKHGNRAASGNSGSSDVLLQLGVAIDADVPLLRRSLSDLKITFLFAPRFHPGLSNVAPIRRQLPFRTVFNLVGPLCNPASPSYQVLGTPEGRHADLLADVLVRLPYIRRAAVVSGSDGLDEVTLDGPTRVRVVEEGMVRHFVWQPEDLGLKRSSARPLRVRDATESAERIVRVFAREPGPVRDFILANAAAALWVTGHYALRDGVEVAKAAIDSGAAAALLEQWRQLAPVEMAGR